MAISDVERVSRDKIREALLKRSEKIAEEQHFRLRDLLRYNLKTVRAYLLRKPSSSSGLQFSGLGRQVPRRVAPASFSDDSFYRYFRPKHINLAGTWQSWKVR
jgi:hypothetical protein